MLALLLVTRSSYLQLCLPLRLNVNRDSGGLSNFEKIRGKVEIKVVLYMSMNFPT